ncbi:MAG: tRNA epoxyqueuosine(34) reductase QueG [Thermoanaerobaculia bacterium]
MLHRRPRATGPRWPPPPHPEDPLALSRAIVDAARRHGFCAAGVVAADAPASYETYQMWLEAGHHGEMTWLERDAEARRRLDSVLPYCRSVLAVAWQVPEGEPGNIARYSRGEDYHRVLRRKLHAVIEDVKPLAPKGSHFRVCVDTAPVLERDLALRAGLGFIGKNGLLIIPGVGSHVVLGEILTDILLASTAAAIDGTLDRCGSCMRCLESCPTDAFVAPRLLDARRCLSYLTIEKRGPLSPEQEQSLDGALFGCDICQDVCPWNEAIPHSGLPAAFPSSLDPADLVALDREAFEERFADTAIWRATPEGLSRNARAALARTPS